jgi:glutathione synthase
LIEINVFSQGGLGSAHQFEWVNFNETVIKILERKVAYMGHYHRNLTNEEMATI